MSVTTRVWAACSLALLLSFPALAQEATESAAPGRIAATFDDEPLEEAIAILAMLSGTPIEIEGDVTDQRVSTTLHDATLQESLDDVLDNLSYVVIRRTDGGVTILALGEGEQETLSDASNSGGAGPVPMGMTPDASEVLPGTDLNSPGFTAADIAYYKAQAQQIDPESMEVVPTAQAGGKGMTKAEFDAAMAKQQQQDRSQIEVLPPTNPGAAGLTVAELEAMLSEEQPQRALEDEVPPQ